MRDLRSVPAMRPPGSPRQGVPGRLHIRAAGERPPRARPQRRGSPGPIPNPAVKPAFAESTAAQGCGRAGRRARGGRFSIRAVPRAARRGECTACAEKARRGIAPAGLSRVLGLSRGRGALYAAYLALRALGAVRWRQLGLRFLGTLRHRVGCAPDFDRHGGGAMSRVCRRVSAYMLPRAVSCLSCCWFVRSVLRSVFSVLHFMVNVFDS